MSRSPRSLREPALIIHLVHGTMGLQKSDPARARNILQHGIGTWVSRCDFGTLSDKHVASVATGMQRRLLELGDGQGIGFSQSDK